MVFDHFFDIHEIVKDIIKRPYITVGFSAFVMLIPLAATSTKNWVKRLGSRWARLHRLIYLGGAMACIHYWWLVKTGVRTPWKVTAVLTVLLLVRLGFWVKKRATVGKVVVAA